MRSLALSVFPFLLSAADPSVRLPNSLTPIERAEGWQLLFDGASFANFSLSKLKNSTWWKIEDGWIASIPQGKSPEGRRLFTLGSYGDFELTFQWKIAREGNSGIKYRIQRVWSARGGTDYRSVSSAVQVPLAVPTLDELMTGTAIGFEYQVADDENEPSALQSPLGRTGALYGLRGSDAFPRVKPDTIHTSRIVVKGLRTQHWLDERKLLEMDLRSDAILEALKSRLNHGIERARLAGPGPSQERYSGILEQVTAESLLRHDIPWSPIDFQHHRSGVWFRAIKIRHLQ